ncbi:MAG: SDR family oxidoreductase [Lachnospiraceae bacterium]|nr:SDR family oxidoreductase [Lachnospiraceae bacterium]
MAGFTGKIAVVTGAGGTLCSLLSERLAEAGAKVILVGRTREKLDVVAERIRAFGGVCAVKCCDATDEAAVQGIADEVFSEFGPCDLLLNGAGGNSADATTKKEAFTEDEFEPGATPGFFDLSLDAVRRVLDVNTLGTVIPCRVFGAQMAKADGGAILNFASMNTYKPLTKNPAYAMAKAAVSNFTEWLAAYLAPAGIRVNAVAPGFFLNERSQKFLLTPEGTCSPRGEKVMAHTPMKRFGEAEDLWGTVEWLLDDEKSAFVTGVTVPVDGGFIAHPGV